MLHPLQATRRSAAEQAAAFDHLCLGDLKSLGKKLSPSRDGGNRRAGDRIDADLDDVDLDNDADPDAEARLRLRGAVPRAKWRFAGAVVSNMRDAGFEDRDTVQVLQALFPQRRQHDDVTQATLQRVYCIMWCIAWCTAWCTAVVHCRRALRGALPSCTAVVHCRRALDEDIAQATLRSAWAVFGGGELVRVSKVTQ